VVIISGRDNDGVPPYALMNSAQRTMHMSAPVVEIRALPGGLRPASGSGGVRGLWEGSIEPHRSGCRSCIFFSVIFDRCHRRPAYLSGRLDGQLRLPRRQGAGSSSSFEARCIVTDDARIHDDLGAIEVRLELE
jgi:hypothetical protein